MNITPEQIEAMADRLSNASNRMGSVLAERDAAAMLCSIAAQQREAEPVACRLYNGEGGYNYTDDKETMERWVNKENGWGEYLYLHSKQIKKVDYPECSGDVANCPENEGYGCCMPNPRQRNAVEVTDEMVDNAAIPDQLIAWLSARDLLPDLDDDGSLDIDQLIVALNDHENELLRSAVGAASQENKP